MSSSLFGASSRLTTALCVFGLLANFGLTLYSHLGLSAEITTDVKTEDMCERRLAAANCNTADKAFWLGGAFITFDDDNLKCGLYNCSILAMKDPVCVSGCFARNYTGACSRCFGEFSFCSGKNCLAQCMPPKHMSAACKECNAEHCDAAWTSCTGFTKTGEVREGQCPERADRSIVLQPLGGEGEITFFNSVERSWSGGAKTIAIVIVIFSGIWPYLNTILLAIAWFVPMTPRLRTIIIDVVLRLGKWSLIDVFAVVSVVAAVNFEVQGQRIVAVCRPAIYTFGISVVIHHVQAEWMAMYDQRIQGGTSTAAKSKYQSILRVAHAPVALVAAGLTFFGLLGTAVMMEVRPGKNCEVTGGGTWSFATLGTAVPTSFSEGADGGTWILLAIYYVFGFGLPLLVSAALAVNAVVHVLGLPKPPAKLVLLLSKAVDFCAADVLLFATLVVMSEYEKLIEGMVENSEPSCPPGMKPYISYSKEMLPAQSSALHAGIWVLLASFLPWFYVAGYTIPGAASETEVAGNGSNEKDAAAGKAWEGSE